MRVIEKPTALIEGCAFACVKAVSLHRAKIFTYNLEPEFLLVHILQAGSLYHERVASANHWQAIEEQ